MRVKIWCPESGSFDDAKEVYASENNLGLAVESYAKRDWSDSDYWESSEFHVAYDGKVRRFIVRAEQSVEFYVREVRK